jgi:ribosome-binding factor A
MPRHRAQAKGPARKVRLESLLRREIAVAVQTQVNDPKLGFLTVTRCELTADLQQVTAFWTCVGTPSQRQRAQAVLERVRGMIQTAYAPAITMRLLPILRFHYDDQEEQRTRMDDLIRRARATDPAPPGDPA